MIRATLLVACVAGLAAAELPRRAEVEALAAQTQAWLIAKSQADGSLAEGGTLTAGITAFAAGALVQPPQALPASHPAVAGALRYLGGLRHADGGYYDPKEGLGNYVTALTLEFVVRLNAADRPGFDVPAMQRYILGLQNTDPASLGSGGIGYNADKSAGAEDLSNTAYAVQSLRASGVPAADPRLQAALGFLQRCQDLSAVNHQPWVGQAGGAPGGGVYGPQDAARSWESRDTGGTPRFVPTASMTYALVSSYLALDLSADDPRVKAALGWLAANWGFEANPGLGAGREQQGIFHLQALAARTFDLLPATTITLADGRVVDWRADLYAAVAKRAQRMTLADGTPAAFWINEAPRWGEGIPHLSTAYALRALKTVARHLPD